MSLDGGYLYMKVGNGLKNCTGVEGSSSEAVSLDKNVRVLAVAFRNEHRVWCLMLIYLSVCVCLKDVTTVICELMKSRIVFKVV